MRFNWNDFFEQLRRGPGFIRSLIFRLLEGFLLFGKKGGSVLAGSATYYAILSFFPMVLFLLSVTGFIFGNIVNVKGEMFSIFQSNFPEVFPAISSTIERLSLSSPSLFHGLAWLNLGLLLWSASAFFHSILYGINLVMGEGMPKSWAMRLKSFATIGLLVAFFAVLLVLGPFTVILSEVLKQNFFVDFISDFYSGTQNVIYFITLILLNVNILTVLLSVGFLTLVFHGLFLTRVSYLDSLFGAVVFIVLFLSEKYFFWIYLHYARNGLVQSYGDLYTFIAMILWIYFFMCAFFYAAFVTYAGAERRKDVTDLPGA